MVISCCSIIGSAVSALHHRPQSSLVNMVTASRGSPMGRFAILSPEVRSLIWQGLFSDGAGSSDPREYRWMQTGKVGDLLMLSRVNSCFNDEIMAEFYRRKTLCFAIHPFKDEWTVPGLEGAEPVDFLRVKFARFQKIKVNIYAPDRGDPGQVLRTRMQVINLVCMLARLQYVLRDDGVGRDKPQHPQILLNQQGQEGWPAPPAGYRLPDMEIELVDQGYIMWCFDLWIWKHVSLDRDTFAERIVGIFEYLRGCPNATIIVPPQDGRRRGIDDDDDDDDDAGHDSGDESGDDSDYDADKDDDDDDDDHNNVSLYGAFQKIIACMESAKPFGTERYDAHIRSIESARSVFLDRELDNLCGHTAEILRLQRFQNWWEYTSTMMALIEVNEEGGRSNPSTRASMRQRTAYWAAWKRTGIHVNWVPSLKISWIMYYPRKHRLGVIRPGKTLIFSGSGQVRSMPAGDWCTWLFPGTFIDMILRWHIFFI